MIQNPLPPRIPSGSVLVTDWATKDRLDRVLDVNYAEEAWPYQQLFNDEELLSQYLNKPCEVPTAMRFVHGVNVPWAAKCFPRLSTNGPSYNDFMRPSESSARHGASIPTYIAKEKVELSSSQFPAKQNVVRLLIDYFPFHWRMFEGKGTMARSPGARTYNLTTPDGSGETSLVNYVTCLQDITVFLRKGRDCRHAALAIYCSCKDPAYSMVVIENLSGSDSSLLLQRDETDVVDHLSGKRFAHTGLAAMCLYIHSLLRSVANQWEQLLILAVLHYRDLEEQIYLQPDDDSRASILWTLSKTWLDMERLLQAHVRGVQDTEVFVNDLLQKSPLEPALTQPTNAIDEERKKLQQAYEASLVPENWEEISCQKILKEFNHHLDVLQNDLIKPTSIMLDMMYKSAAIRDTRLSLELNTSLWRLSWITFIFLPLTFLSGFFGMNVDLLANDPPIKWYFISGAGIIVIFFLVWLFFKLSHRFRHKAKKQSLCLWV